MTTLFQETIEHLLKSHNLLDDFQNKDSFHVRFDKTGYQPLVIERHGEMISVAHYFERDGKTYVDTHFHKEVSSFLSMWARNIKAQGWAEGGRVSDD